MTNTIPHSLSGKRALVTGGSKGIGLAIALALAEAGARVVISARKQADLDEALAQITTSGGEGFAIVCDVADPDQVAAMRTVINDQWGGVDILVNNAGTAPSHKFITHPDDLWHETLAVNLTGVYYVTKAFAGGMLDQKWGRIINIASIVSKIGGKYIAAYTASKHGVLGLTRALAMEFVPHVTVNAICPGYVDTPMTDAAVSRIMEKTGRSVEEARAEITKTSPQGRLIEPDEVAAVALMLAQESARGITGQAINVDGGAVMW
jgi:NAD(P)-dependent dehydrogenase (short-subunit alcohol dehydrogenase family)